MKTIAIAYINDVDEARKVARELTERKLYKDEIVALHTIDFAEAIAIMYNEQTNTRYARTLRSVSPEARERLAAKTLRSVDDLLSFADIQQLS